MHDSSLPIDPARRYVQPCELLRIARDVAACPLAWGSLLEGGGERPSHIGLFTNPLLEISVIEWLGNDDATGFHDHGASCTAVFVARGTILHTLLRPGHGPLETCVTAGEGFCFDHRCVHRMRRRAPAESTVTIHVYSPPLGRIGRLGQEKNSLLPPRPA